MASPREFTIYVVVADAAVRDSLYVLLRSLGFATWVGSVAEFREEYRPVQKSCLVIDEDLGGTSGFDLLEGLRSERVRTPAIVMTEQLGAGAQAAGERLGAMLMEKPYTPDKLIGCLVKSLGREPT